MNLDEIKKALAEGKRVFYANISYEVLHDTSNGCDQYLIAYHHGGSDANYIGLTWRDGVTMNGKPEDFFILGS